MAHSRVGALASRSYKRVGSRHLYAISSELVQSDETDEDDDDAPAAQTICRVRPL